MVAINATVSRPCNINAHRPSFLFLLKTAIVTKILIQS
jgi:hypothetical protein